MPVSLRQNGQSVDEENPPNHEQARFIELVDPFSPSLAVQMKSYQRQRQKKAPPVGEVPVCPSQSIQDQASEEEDDLEKNLSNRLSWGSERVAGLCHQNGGEAPAKHDRGRRSDKDQLLRECKSASRLKGGEIRDDTTINQGAQSQNDLKNAYAPSSTSASLHSTPPNSRPASIVLQQSPFMLSAAIPSRSFLPQQKEPPQFSFASIAIPKEEPLKIRIYVLIVHVILPQIYLHCLLRVPYLYLSRVHEIFQDSTITLKDFENLTLMDGVEHGSMSDFSESSKQSYARMKANWETFIDGLMREWKTFNIISGLLLSGILSIFQAEGANAEAITRYAALCSLICALISLIYGCFFIIRFGSMRRVSRGVEWASAACSDQSLIWNVYVLLAMPIIWLIWSIISFIISIISFTWRVRPGHDIPHVSDNWDFIFRLFVCLVLGLGMAYAVLIISTLRHYGAEMDKAWNCRMREFWNRRPCDNGSRRKGQPQQLGSTMAYIVPPSPSPTTSTAKAHAFERLPVFPASISMQSQPLTSPTLLSPSPVALKRTPQKQQLSMEFPGSLSRHRSSVDEDATSPVVEPPTPTYVQSSANSYMESFSNSNHTISPVNESQLPPAVPPTPSEGLPLILENSNERIPPSISRRPKAVAASSIRGSRRDLMPTIDPPVMPYDAESHATPPATDPSLTPKEPDIQLLPLAKTKLKSHVNNGESGEQLPQLTGVGNIHLEPPLSRPPNAHRSTSETIVEFRCEGYRADADTDAGRGSHPEPHVSSRVPLSQPQYAHQPTSEMVSEVGREERGTNPGVDRGGKTKNTRKKGLHWSKVKVMKFSGRK